MQGDRSRRIHLYAGSDHTVLRSGRLARLSRLGVSGVWLRVDRAGNEGGVNRALRRAGRPPGGGMRGSAVPQVVLYTEDPALLEPVLRTQAFTRGTFPVIALPFGLAGELAGHAGLLAPGLSVYLTAFRREDAPEGREGKGEAQGSGGRDGGGDAGGRDAAEAFALELARSTMQLRRALGDGARLRVLLFHPRIVAGYRLNLLLRDVLETSRQGKREGTAGGPEERQGEVEGAVSGPPGGPVPQVLALAAEEPPGALYECALRAGALLYEGVGDTLLLMPPSGVPGEKGVGFPQARAAVSSLATVMEELGIVPRAYTVVSCPTCGRCVMDIPAMAKETDRMLERVTARYRRRGRPVERAGGITVAVMGCNVNGPGEARAADVGIAGGEGGTGTLFRGGRPVETLPERRLLPALKRQVTWIIKEKLDRETGPPG